MSEAWVCTESHGQLARSVAMRSTNPATSSPAARPAAGAKAGM